MPGHVCKAGNRTPHIIIIINMGAVIQRPGIYEKEKSHPAMF